MMELLVDHGEAAGYTLTVSFVKESNPSLLVGVLKSFDSLLVPLMIAFPTFFSIFGSPFEFTDTSVPKLLRLQKARSF
jgi:hypothetical protein